jgi:hypothetical protein
MKGSGQPATPRLAPPPELPNTGERMPKKFDSGECEESRPDVPSLYSPRGSNPVPAVSSVHLYKNQAQTNLIRPRRHEPAANTAVESRELGTWGSRQRGLPSLSPPCQRGPSGAERRRQLRRSGAVGGGEREDEVGPAR